MTIKEMFIETISKALTSAEMISDAAQKSEAYASIASALARTGMVRGSEEVTAVANDKEELKLENSKGKKEKKNPENLKAAVTNNPAKLEEVAQAEQAEEAGYAAIEDQDTVIPNSDEEAQEGVDDLQEWTEETQAQFAAEIEYVQQATDYIGKEETEEAISLFTNGISNDISFISPANIKGFVVYLECYIRERNADQ